MFLNADTLTNKLTEFQFLIQHHQPHIIGVNEVLPKNFSKQIHPEEFHIDGYEMIVHPNVARNIGRGSILYISKKLIYKELKLFNDSEEFEESITIEVKLKGKDRLLCSCMYRRGESTADNNEKLMENIRHMANLRYSHFLMMGDFNLREIDWENCSSKIKNSTDINSLFTDCVRDCYLYQHIQEPTRQRGTDCPSVLDLIFTNEEDMVSDIQILSPLGKSDHSVILFDFICETETNTPQIKSMFQKGDYTKMAKLMNEVKWEELYDYEDDIDKQWEFFKDRFTEIENQCVPKKLVYVNGKLSKKFSVPLDKKTLAKIKQKNKIWGRIRKQLAADEEKIRFNRLRNQIRGLTRKSKRIIEKEVAKNTKANSKAFWKYAQSKLKTRAAIPYLVTSDDEDDEPTFTKNEQEKADTFLKNFSSVFTVEADGEDMPFFGKRSYAKELSNIQISEDIVKQKLKKLKLNKSPGPDKIHPRVLHEISDVIAVPITIIFQNSLAKKDLPQEWKHAHISAIFKKGVKTQPLNYRPVSLTSVVCKIMESIIRDNIITHMKENNLFSDKQFGFIMGRSTTLQLLHVLDIWTEILDQGGTLDVIYCDFMKAFDKVPHRRLIHKIEKYGITGNILGWTKAFLSGRTQCVVLNEVKSKIARVTSGIPQGSVLGPILFVIYINDMPEVVDKDSIVYLFADDTKVFRHIKSQEDTIQLQSDINNLLQWSEKWLLKFHPDKCVSMTVSNKRSFPPQNQYSMGQTPLQVSECEKDIGIYIDNKLQFDNHVENMVFKANRILAVVRNTFNYLDQNTFRYIFKGLVRPHLEYAAPVWSPHSIYQKDLIENVQRRATKLIPGLNNLSYPERLKKLKLPTLAYRRARGDMIQVFKMTSKMGGYDKSLPNLLTPNDNELRGHSQKLFTHGSNKDVRKYFFSNRIVKIWNSLPEWVISSADVYKFENNLDSFRQDQELLYDNHTVEISIRPVKQ